MRVFSIVNPSEGLTGQLRVYVTNSETGQVMAFTETGGQFNIESPLMTPLTSVGGSEGANCELLADIRFDLHRLSVNITGNYAIKLPENAPFSY